MWSLAGEYDLTTADGRRHFREAMVAAAGESDKISERVKRGKLRRARKGRHHGGGRAFGMPGNLPAPEGWEPGDPRQPAPAELIATERDLIRECYGRLFAGEHIATLVREINARQIRTTYGHLWTRSTLRRSLSRPAVAGLLVHRGEVIGTMAGIEPVVSREEWERMCAILAGRPRGRPAGRVHVLSGLIRCSRCGYTMTGVPRRGKTPYPDGSPRREYRCRSAADRPYSCGRNHIDAQAAENAVEHAVKTRLGDPRRAERIARRLARAQEDRARIETEMATLRESADELAGKTARWGVARVDKAMEPILTRLAELDKALAGIDEPEDADTAAADVAQAWDDAKSRGDLDTLRAMIKRAFPNLALRPATGWNDHSPARFDWDGPAPSVAS